jgi:hypothetical protein
MEWSQVTETYYGHKGKAYLQMLYEIGFGKRFKILHTSNECAQILIHVNGFEPRNFPQYYF